MDLWRSNIFLMIYFFCVTALAETPLELPQYLNQYEINSETVYFSDSKLVQSDLRLLVGRRLSVFRDDSLRLAVGAYGLYQDSELYAYSYRKGGLAQAKMNVWENWLFVVYEYHYYKMQDTTSYQHENRYGLYGGYLFEFDARKNLDIYAETFHIPNVSKKHLLSSGRVSIYWDSQFADKHVLDYLVEVYAKDSPQSWGGSRTDLRLGVKIQPWSFISARLFVPLASSERAAAGEWQSQLNIYKVGDF